MAQHDLRPVSKDAPKLENAKRKLEFVSWSKQRSNREVDDTSQGPDAATENNRSVYEDPVVTGRIADADGWINPGEQAALLSVASTVRGKRILDVGVGTGRTISLLKLLSDDYVAVDYSQRRVEMCHRRYPGVDVRMADARNLAEFDERSFDFVFFSFYGIDSMDHEGRARALSEFHRILRPGGILSYSTLNRDGMSFNEKPWQVDRPGRRTPLSPRKLARAVLVPARHPLRFWCRLNHWRANRSRSQQGDGWCIGPLASQDFVLTIHFITLTELRRELKDSGFDVIAIFESEDGRTGVIDASTTTSNIDGFHVVATR